MMSNHSIVLLVVCVNRSWYLGGLHGFGRAAAFSRSCGFPFALTREPECANGSSIVVSWPTITAQDGVASDLIPKLTRVIYVKHKMLVTNRNITQTSCVLQEEMRSLIY